MIPSLVAYAGPATPVPGMDLANRQGFSARVIMLKFLASTVGTIILIALALVILLLMLIF